jgi:signal transduction histidine kinase
MRYRLRYGLRWRILILAAAAPAVLGPAALWFVDRSVSAHVRTTIDENLQSATLVCERILTARARTLATSAQVIAQQPRFFSALNLPADARDAYYKATVQGVARDFNRIAKADLFEVLDRRGQLIASVGEASTHAKRRRPLIEAARGGQTATGVIIGEDATLMQVAVHSVVTGKRVVGFLILGSRTGDGLASEIKVLTRSEVSFLARGALSGSTLPIGPERNGLPAALAARLEATHGGFPDGVTEIEVASTTFLTFAGRIPGAGEGDAVFYVIQRSLAGETVFLGAIQSGLVKLGGWIILASLIMGLLVAHRITRPVHGIMRAAEEMERGNYDHPLDVQSEDEIGYLAERFREMRDRQRAYVNSLEEAARLKGAFLSVASHELRTPVSIIKAYNELLSAGSLGPVGRRQKKVLGVISQQLDGIERIIEDATWVAQIEGERPILNLGEHEVREVIEEAVGVAITDARGRMHHFSIDIQPDLGRARLDGARLIQATAHLVRNAIRFTPDGGQIGIQAERQRDELVISVTDTGIGIEEDKKPHLFDRSFMLRDYLQHHSSGTLEFNSAGLGLGLPLARGIVEAHGGTIRLESQIGHGSTFTIRIPLEIPPAAASKFAA